MSLLVRNTPRPQEVTISCYCGARFPVVAGIAIQATCPSCQSVLTITSRVEVIIDLWRASDALRQKQQQLLEEYMKEHKT